MHALSGIKEEEKRRGKQVIRTLNYAKLVEQTFITNKITTLSALTSKNQRNMVSRYAKQPSKRIYEIIVITN